MKKILLSSLLFLVLTSKAQSLYQILGVGNDASQTDIRGAYRSISLQNHPDRNRNVTARRLRELRNIFEKATKARNILVNESCRHAYDVLCQRSQEDEDFFIEEENLEEYFPGQISYKENSETDYSIFIKNTDIMSECRWIMGFQRMSWYNIKKIFHHGLLVGVKSLPLILASRAISQLGKKFLGFSNKSEQNRENLIKKIIGYQYIEGNQKVQKKLKDELKDAWKKVIATQKSLINDGLDEKQREKLHKRLKKYMKNYQDIKQEMDELRDDNQEDFKAFIQQINK